MFGDSWLVSKNKSYYFGAEAITNCLILKVQRKDIFIHFEQIRGLKKLIQKIVDLKLKERIKFLKFQLLQEQKGIVNKNALNKNSVIRTSKKSDREDYEMIDSIHPKNLSKDIILQTRIYGLHKKEDFVKKKETQRMKKANQLKKLARQDELKAYNLLSAIPQRKKSCLNYSKLKSSFSKEELGGKTGIYIDKKIFKVCKASRNQAVFLKEKMIASIKYPKLKKPSKDKCYSLSLRRRVPESRGNSQKKSIDELSQCSQNPFFNRKSTLYRKGSHTQQQSMQHEYR